MHSLEQKIRAAEAQGRTALIPFVTGGFPTLTRFWEILDELDTAGADILEIGIPFSDPVADGPVVEAASLRALQQGVSLRLLLEGLRHRHYQAGLVLMGYYNSFLQYGLKRFAADAAAAGVGGCIVPDLPLGEDKALRTALRAHGLALIPLVGPNTSPQRMAAYAAEGEGYVYVVSLLGTTGVQQGLPPEAQPTLALAKHIFRLPVALGFGLHSPEQLASLPAEARPQAAIFGSALLQHLDAGGSGQAFLAPWHP